MLNPELAEEYGDDSLLFFDAFARRLDIELLNKCYALKNSIRLRTGKLVAPEYIGVVSYDYDEVGRANSSSINVSFELREEYDEDDNAVVCIRCDAERADKEGIKIWVG